MQKEEGIDVSVVIATLSRPTLDGVLKSIREDLPRAQIIVVTHGAPSKQVDSLFSKFGIQYAINDTDSIGHSWNLGLMLVEREYFTFFSDDDLWIANSLNLHKKKLEESEYDFILGSVELKKSSKIKKIKPKAVIKKTFLELLENSAFLPGTKYVSLTSFLGKKHLTQQHFEENVPFWEDILWLLNLEKSGYKFYQDTVVRSSIEIDYSRGSKRESTASYFVISEHLKKIKAGLDKSFIKNIAIRNSVVAGESAKIKDLLTELHLKSNVIQLEKWEKFQMVIMLQIAKLIGKIKK